MTSGDECCKVRTVTNRHDLTSPSQETDNIDEYLATRWTGNGSHEREGLRTLTDWFNKQLLRTVYYRNGRKVYDTKINAEYWSLSDTGDNRPERMELLTDLESDGIDGEAISDDFISKSTLGRHLKNCLGVQKSQSSPDRGSDWELDRIQFSRSEFEKNLHKPLDSLDKKRRLPGAGEAELSTPIMLSCPQCPTRTRFETALEQGYICKDHLGHASGDDHAVDTLSEND